MTIIEADGVETEPLTVDSLNIFAGEYLVNITLLRLVADPIFLYTQFWKNINSFICFCKRSALSLFLSDESSKQSLDI